MLRGLAVRSILQAGTVVVLALPTLFSIQSCSQPLDYDEVIDACRESISVDARDKPSPIRIVDPDCLLGAPIPSFSETDLSGNSIDSDDFKGGVTVINFWFIACPPCVEEIPELRQLQAEYEERGVRFIAIGRDSKEDTEEFISEYDWQYEHIYDANELLTETFRRFWGFPMTFVLDKKSRIRSVHRSLAQPGALEAISASIEQHL